MNIFNENITKPLKIALPAKENKLRRSVIWIILVVITLVLDLVLPKTIGDLLYYRGLFMGLRPVYDYIFGYSPIPMVYLLGGAILVRAYNWIKERKKGFIYMMVRAIGGIAAVIFFFYWFWAFNYHQISIPERLGFDLKSVQEPDIQQEFDRASLSLLSAANALPNDMRDDLTIQKKVVCDNDLRPDVEQALKTLALPHLGRVRVRQLLPKGILLRWSTAGIYIPQAGEGHIDAGLLSVQKPYTMAHEMAHGYGVTDEGACNFIAWLACERSTNPWIRYSGALSYWKYAAYEVQPDSVHIMMKTFPEVIERSIELVRENDKKYPDLFPKYRDAIYTSYLKHHGVEEGLRSYDEVVLMVQQFIKHNSMGANTK
jgi:hypothetical protein